MKRATLILLAAIGMLLGTTTARADDYTGDCAGVSSWDGNGNANISDSGNCTISNDLSATGYINISASGTINTQALTASDGYVVVSGGGIVTVGGDITTNGWTVIVSSPSDISLQNVYTSGTGYHDVRILANSGGSGSDQFVIGSAGATNGVGTIDASNSDGYDNIYISNGASGGISYSGTGILDVSASGGQAGRITLDTEDGTGNIVLNGGTIVADGSGYPAGDINLVTSASGAIVVSSNTTLSVQGSGPYPFIDLSSDTITLNANLTVTMSGGNIANNGEIGGITPNGSASIVAPTDPDEAIYFTPWVTSNNNLSITGTGTLAWNATGDYTGLSFSGNNLIITANLIVHNTGNGVSTYLSSNDSSFNAQPITIGNVQLYANSSTSGDTGGTVTLGASQLTSITGPVLLDASGTGGGDGGTVYFFPGNGNVPFGASGGNYFQANVNGSSTGGNAGLFETWGNGSAAYNVSFQTADGITASAQSSDGNGGSITMYVNDMNFALSNATMHADAVGAGNGGTINLNNSTMEFTGTTSSITANGAGMSSGGSPTNGITIWTGSSLNLGSGTAGDVLLSANALSSGGTGGNINVSAGEIDADGGSITVTAGASGNGGTISLTSFDELDIDNTLDASGGSTQGAGGNIDLFAYGDLNLMPAGLTTVKANGSGSGAGGTITLTASTDIYIDDSDFKLQANASGTGDGGTINITALDVSLSDSDLTVTAGTSGKGGTISLTADPGDGTITVNNALDASAGTVQGAGGSIYLNADTIATGDGLMLTATGTDTGAGGTISLISGEILDLSTSQINATGGDNGPGGVVYVYDVHNFDVNKVITDSAGSDVTDTSTFDGSISLNQVPCTQILTGNIWPPTYWDCVNSSPTATDGVPADEAEDVSDNILALMDPSMTPIQLYVFLNPDASNSFFNGAATTDATGNTEVGPDDSQIIYSSVFETGLTDSQLSETTAHELGHAIDLGSDNQSQTSAENTLADSSFGKYVQNDFFYLDYTSWPTGSDPYPSDVRSACGSGAPLQGLEDPVTNVQFCGSGDGYDATLGIESIYVTSGHQWRISHILQHLTSDVPLSYIFTQSSANTQNFGYTGGWSELYAQAYAFQAYLVPNVSDMSSTVRPLENAIFAQGLFACTQDWTSSMVSNTQPPSTTPSLPSPMSGTCTSAVPSWYLSAIGQ